MLSRMLSLQNAPTLDQVINGTRRAMEVDQKQRETISLLRTMVLDLQALAATRVQEEDDWRVKAMAEAVAMAGAGPWRSPTKAQAEARFKEALAAQGAFGDIELALQDVTWRREVNSTWLEFSRWGIQQIILISRLYYVKNPLVQRGTNVSAMYVFGRGVEMSSPDEAANEAIQTFLAANEQTLGISGLMDLERRTYYDGNLFFALFADDKNTGQTIIRTIDATEIMEVITDPEDAETPWYYKRVWNQGTFDPATGQTSIQPMSAYYPALDYEPDAKPAVIDEKPVHWESPVYHRKCGGVGKWHFGCPLVYAAIDWAQAARRFLEDCMTVRNALAQYAMILKTKGGQSALQGFKNQQSTQVGPNAALWDKNPPAVAGSTFASGFGTEIEAFNTKGAGGDPGDVREYKLMVAMVFGIPESFFADMETSNLATATSLDRPTELNFMAKQERWREDFVRILRYVLRVSSKATSGVLREAMDKAKLEGDMRIFESPRRLDKNGRWHYEAVASKEKEVQIQVVFPSIIEADMPAQVGAIVQSLTLGSKMGSVNGIDWKTGVDLLLQQLGVEDREIILEAMFPEASYDPERPALQDANAAAGGNGGNDDEPEPAGGNKPGSKGKPKAAAA